MTEAVDQVSSDVRQTQLVKAVAPFAEQFDALGPPTQGQYDRLREAFGALDHPDFIAMPQDEPGLENMRRSHTPTPRCDHSNGKAFHLPVRMALGLHGSVKNRDAEVLQTVIGVYQEGRSIGVREGRERWQRSLAQSAIFGAIVEAATDRWPERQVGEAITLSRKEGLLSIEKSLILRRTVAIVDIW